jgi:C1A family cysteine protease
MKAAIAIACLFAVGALALSETEYQGQFISYIEQFDKTYAHEEFFNRFNIFKSWVDTIEAHNAGNHTWTMAINQFSDLTPAEFKEKHLSGLPARAAADQTEETIYVADPSQPNDIDWRSKGAVTPVKNQGQCGSCWSFSATGAIEGWAVAKGGKSLVSLSEQMFVDCTRSVGNQGCNGGWPDKTIGWAATHGVTTEAAYPYTGRDGSCKSFTPTYKFGGDGTGSGESTLAGQLGSQPVSVCVDASGGFQSYHSGVFSGPCGTQINHAILAVGYTSAYWIVKNSWGTSWGSSGYIYMARGKNLCGVNQNLAWAK